MVHQLSAETDTIIEYVSLYREQRSALVRKEKERETEIKNLSKSKLEVQERVNELELLLKSTVQNIKPTTVRKVRRKPAVEKPEGATDGTNDEEITEDGQKSPDQEDLESGDHVGEGESIDEEEFEIIEGNDSFFICRSIFRYTKTLKLGCVFLMVSWSIESRDHRKDVPHFI